MKKKRAIVCFVFLFSANLDGSGKMTLVDEPLIESSKCLMYNPLTDEILENCSNGIGICKSPIGRINSSLL